MPAVMHVIVLVSSLAVCSGMPASTVTAATGYEMVANTTAAQFSNFTTSFTGNDTTSAPQSQTVILHTTEVNLTSPQTPGSGETNSTASSETTTTLTETSPGNFSQETTSASSNVSTTVNTTSPVSTQRSTSSPKQVHATSWVKEEVTSNSGLVAVLCIFVIVSSLLLVVVTVKCVRSPRSNFERLEDMPMGKVNEESPFAHFSK